MTGYLRLADAKDSYEIADAYLAVGDKVQQTQTSGICERPEKQFQGRVRLGHHTSIYHIRLDIYDLALYADTHMDIRI
jgi:hypothetical protein